MQVFISAGNWICMDDNITAHLFGLIKSIKIHINAELFSAQGTIEMN